MRSPLASMAAHGRRGVTRRHRPPRWLRDCAAAAYVLAEDLAREGRKVPSARAHVQKGETLAQLEGLECGTVDGGRREVLDAVAKGQVDVANFLAAASPVVGRIDEEPAVDGLEGSNDGLGADGAVADELSHHLVVI